MTVARVIVTVTLATLGYGEYIAASKIGRMCRFRAFIPIER
jgi:hypothetical protein